MTEMFYHALAAKKADALAAALETNPNLKYLVPQLVALTESSEFFGAVLKTLPHLFTDTCLPYNLDFLAVDTMTDFVTRHHSTFNGLCAFMSWFKMHAEHTALFRHFDVFKMDNRHGQQLLQLFGCDALHVQAVRHFIEKHSEPIFEQLSCPRLFRAVAEIRLPNKSYYPLMCHDDPFAVVKILHSIAPDNETYQAICYLPAEVMPRLHTKQVLPMSLPTTVSLKEAKAMVALFNLYALPCLARSDMSLGASELFYKMVAQLNAPRQKPLPVFSSAQYAPVNGGMVAGTAVPLGLVAALRLVKLEPSEVMRLSKDKALVLIQHMSNTRDLQACLSETRLDVDLARAIIDRLRELDEINGRPTSTRKRPRVATT